MTLSEPGLVRVLRLPAEAERDGWAVNRYAPGIGDRGAVVQVLHTASGEARYVVESPDSEGQTMWLAEFERDALAPAHVHPFEPLSLMPLASGGSSIALGRRVGWSAFAPYAESVVQRLGASIVERVQNPTEHLWTLACAGQRFSLRWEEFGAGSVSLDPFDAAASANVSALCQLLRVTRPVMEIEFRMRPSAQGAPRLVTGCAELDDLLSDELPYTAADPDADPPELALARQLGALRAGRSVRVRSGSDAVSLEATPEAVSLEFAGSGAPRPGPQLAFSVFADVFVRWFEATAPRLGGRIRQAIFPATHAL